MKYRIGDKVKVKSLEWYNENKNEFGEVEVPDNVFNSDMSKFCGSIVTIQDIDLDVYVVKENEYYWTDDMFEGLAEEKTTRLRITGIMFPNEKYADKVELCLGNDYEIVVEDGRTFVQRKKPKYPTTYEECCKIMGIDSGNFISIRSLYCIDGEEIITDYEDTLKDKFGVLWKLLICRDAYWKIAWEQMGLSKSWEPEYISLVDNEYFTIHTFNNEIIKSGTSHRNAILSFPTEEMRDAFYENFEKLINDCKELL